MARSSNSVRSRFKAFALPLRTIQPMAATARIDAEHPQRRELLHLAASGQQHAPQDQAEEQGDRQGADLAVEEDGQADHGDPHAGGPLPPGDGGQRHRQADGARRSARCWPRRPASRSGRGAEDLAAVVGLDRHAALEAAVALEYGDLRGPERLGPVDLRDPHQGAGPVARQQHHAAAASTAACR